MAFSLKDWYRNLDSDQKNILQATGCSLLLALLLFLICPTTDGFFLSYLVFSWVATYAFSWRNRTTYSKKKFRSKNGKSFSSKESNKYWIFLAIMIPVSFLIAVLLTALIDPSDEGFHGMSIMAIFQILFSRAYLFHKKIPLRAFALVSGSGRGYNPNAFSRSGSILDPYPNSANGYGSLGPFRRSRRM